MGLLLVALDASPLADVVLAGAIAIAGRLGGRLLLMRAVALPVEVPTALFTLPADSALSALTAQARHDLDELAKRVPEELLAGVQVRVGGASWQAICDGAKEENVAMIIVGSHGHGGLQRLLGTTAAKVVNHADRSVLVIRAPERLGC